MPKYSNGRKTIEAGPGMARRLRAVGYKPVNESEVAEVIAEDAKEDAAAEQQATEEAALAEERREAREAEGRPPPSALD